MSEEKNRAFFSISVDDFCLEAALILRRVLNLPAQPDRDTTTGKTQLEPAASPGAADKEPAQ